MSQTRTLVCKEVATIKQPIEPVWAVISSFGAIKTWMPAIDSCSIEGNGIGAIRTVLWGGQSLKERLEILDDQKHIISYRLLDSPNLPMRGAFGTIILEAQADSQTHITWVSDAEEVDDAGIASVAPLFAPFIRENISTVEKILSRSGHP
jgi:uncharacterized membrane protein